MTVELTAPRRVYYSSDEPMGMGDDLESHAIVEEDTRSSVRTVGLVRRGCISHPHLYMPSVRSRIVRTIWLVF
jgi:hypothetical protein